MNRTTLLTWWIGAFMAVAIRVMAEADLATLQGHYQKGLGNIAEKYQEKQKGLREAYLRSVGNIEETSRKKGDLDSVLAARQEKERFLKTNAMPDAGPTNGPSLVADLQDRYQDVALAMAMDKEKQILDLADRYAKVLAIMEQELTKQNKIEEALQTQKERQEVMQRPEVTAAQFALAEAEVAAQKAMSGSGRPNKPPRPAVN